MTEKTLKQLADKFVYVNIEFDFMRNEILMTAYTPCRRKFKMGKKSKTYSKTLTEICNKFLQLK